MKGRTSSRTLFHDILYVIDCITLQVLTLISEKEVTQVWEGLENTIGKSLDVLYKIEKSCDQCIDRNGPSVILTTEPIRQAFYDLKKRGINVRCITEITQENIEYTKEMMRIAEVRHLDLISGNFTIADGTDYAGVAVTQEAQPITQLLVSNVRAFVQQQQYFFDMLWNKSISAEHRLSQLELGIDPPRIEVLTNTLNTLQLYKDLLKSAQDEVMIILPTLNAITRQQKAGIIKLVVEVGASKSRMGIQILMPKHQSTQIIVDELRKQGNIKIRFIEQSARGTRATFVLVDRKAALIMEIKDDSKDTIQEAIGLSIYSTSKAGVLSAVSIFESLWNQTELYEQLQKANEQLEIQDRLQKEFINIAAHELRTPIQPILGVADLLQSQSPGGKGEIKLAAEELDMIVRNAKRLEHLSSDILAVSRIESQSLRPNKTQINLEDVLSSVLEDVMSGPLRNNKVSLRMDFDTILLEADKDMLIRVLSNLLSNALRFTEQGEITIKAELKGEMAVVSVKDTGAGIDPEILPKLFTKFATKSDRGTGLGLFISKSIIEAHGGKIWGENNKDSNGATFTFTLPIPSELSEISYSNSNRQEEKRTNEIK
jgi:two-component system sensor histidine kinase VicK